MLTEYEMAIYHLNKIMGLFGKHPIIEFFPINLISVNQGMHYIATTITTAQGKLFSTAFITADQKKEKKTLQRMT